MARRYVAVAMAACLLAARARLAAAERICPRAAKAPVVDGKLDDPAWAGALRLADFTRPKSARRPAKAVEARLCFDDKALYVGLLCAEPRPGQLRAEAKIDGENVWKDDCVEVWVRTTPSTLEFDQFIVNTLSARQSLRRRQRAAPGPWRPAWRAKARVEDRRWLAEIRLPFADLEIPPPKPGDMIELKLGREDHTQSPPALSAWPPGSPYAGLEGFECVYFERANVLANADMSRREAGRVAGWGFRKGDEGLFASVAEAGRQVIRFAAPGRYTTANQSLRIKPHGRYRIEADVKGTAGIYLRARTAPKAGAASVPYTAKVAPSAAWRGVRVPFPAGPTGRALILIGNTEGGGAGEVFIANLKVVQEASFETFGPAIAVAADAAEPTVIRKLAVADCRAMKGFLGTPVDGTTHSGDWGGGVWEYGTRGAGAGVWYAYRGSDGLHVTLADGAGFDAVLIRGGARVKMYRDCPRWDAPDGGELLADLPGRTDRSRVRFDEPVRTRRVSFFGLADGHLADVSFFRVRTGAGDLPAPVRLPVGAAREPGELKTWLDKRFDKASRRTLAFGKALAPGGKIAARAGRAFHLLGAPLDAELPLAAVGLDLRLARAPTPAALTVAVQDPLNPKSQLLGADVLVSKPGRCRLVLDFHDQIVPKGTRLWLSITCGADVTLADATVELYAAPRAAALPEALAYRKLLLKTYFVSLSEARPWMRWYDDQRVATSFAEPRWGPQLKELAATLAQCKRLGPADEVVREYDEWVWRRHRARRKAIPPPAARIEPVAGAPEWAVVARQAWLTARDVPRWWIENRMVPTGELGGMVGDDTDMYQNYADFPMFERGGVAAKVRDGAERLMVLADRETLQAGLNRRTMDPLHAYEEGVNHLALLAWWNYGDPVCLERCMVNARSTESLTVVTKKGHRHFKSQQLGAADLRMDRKTDVDGHAHPLMWHPTCELAWYSAHPRALKTLREWADGWLEHMQPGKYATGVEVATERVVETTHRPLYGGYGGLGSAFCFLYWITGEARYVSPFLEAFARGSRNTSPALLLPEMLHRGALAGLDAEKLGRLVRGAGAAETLVTGDKGPLIEALKADIAELQRYRYMYTAAEQYTDRIFLNAIRNAAIAYTGGYASRNKYHHTHAVSWSGLGTDYAALVLTAGRGELKVLVYNFAARPASGRMRVWTLDHGRYRLRVGGDGDGDDKMDKPARAETLELLRASDVSLELPARQVTVVELKQIETLDDERLRADLALSPAEVRIEGGEVRAVAHNIGSKGVASFEAALVDAAGKVRQRTSLGPLAAPLDLVPRRMEFSLKAPPAGPAGWTVVLDPDGKVPEIYEGNNRAAVPRGLEKSR